MYCVRVYTGYIRILSFHISMYICAVVYCCAFQLLQVLVTCCAHCLLQYVASCFHKLH